MELNIKNLTKKFDKNVLFYKQNLNIDFANNRITFITGDNGSGKSTLMKLICGILKAETGEFETKENNNYFKWCKENCYYVSANERGITYKLTGRENIYYLCSLKGCKEKEVKERLNNYSSLFRAESILDCKVEEMSTGQKRKIHLLAAFCSNCEVLLLDEPSIGLDSDNLDLLLTILFKIKNDANKKIIVVSHDKDFRELIMEEEIHIDKNRYIYKKEY